MCKYLFAALIFLPFFSAAQNKWTTGGKLKPEQAIVDIRHYTISLNVDPATQSISGNTVIDFILNEPAPVLLFDLINYYKVAKVWVNDKEQPFTHEGDMIRIQPANAVAAGKASVKVQYAGKPPVAVRPPWEGGFQWAKDSTGKDWIAISCQHDGAKIYFPTKDHTSDEPNEGVDMFITVPQGLVVAGPGLLQNVETSNDLSTYHWKTNYTINTYSIVFNVGNYKVVTRPYTTVDGNKVPMVFYVLEENASKAPYHLEVLERSVRFWEKYCGEFPFVKEKIGIAETPHLGMEHQTMNAYGNKFRYKKVGAYDFDWLLHHEFGHEWWANKVTAKNLEDLWIQEGICSFGDVLMTRELKGEKAYQVIMQTTVNALPNRKPVVAKKDATSADAYHSEIYGKGAFFMHMLRYVIGDSIFFTTLKKLATDPAYTYNNLITTDDVQQLFSKATGKELEPLFSLFLRTTNKMEIRVKKTAINQYQLKVLNLDLPVPLEIITHAGIRRITTNKNGNTFASRTKPVIDPKSFYLKNVIFEQ
ncbi:MAG TPA: M1 family metallopeptidase [Segetibacter sp.]|jgi:aminopeptidase N